MNLTIGHKVEYKSKQWINPDTTAFIFTELLRDYDRSYGTLKIADCRRTIELDIHIFSEEKRDEAVAKVELLAEELIKFKKAMEEITYE